MFGISLEYAYYKHILWSHTDTHTHTYNKPVNLNLGPPVRKAPTIESTQSSQENNIAYLAYTLYKISPLQNSDLHH